MFQGNLEPAAHRWLPQAQDPGELRLRPEVRNSFCFRHNTIIIGTPKVLSSPIFHRRTYSLLRHDGGMGPGHRIRQRRKELDLTQMECASRIGIAQASLSEIETGETRSLRGTTLVGLARVLKTTTRWLMTGKGPHEADAALSEQEEALLGIFTQLSQQNRAAILAAMQAMFRSQAQDNEDGK